MSSERTKLLNSQTKFQLDSIWLGGSLSRISFFNQCQNISSVFKLIIILHLSFVWLQQNEPTLIDRRGWCEHRDIHASACNGVLRCWFHGFQGLIIIATERSLSLFSWPFLHAGPPHTAHISFNQSCNIHSNYLRQGSESTIIRPKVCWGGYLTPNTPRLIPIYWISSSPDHHIHPQPLQINRNANIISKSLL